MRWRRRRAMSLFAPLVLLTGSVSIMPAVMPAAAAVAAPARPTPTGNQASVPDRGLATAPVPTLEGAGKPLPAPVWPAASDKAVTLSGMSVGALVSGTPAKSVVSVGPAAGAVGPMQAKTAGAKPGSPDGVSAGAVAPSSVDVRVLDRTVAAAAGGTGLGVILNRGDGLRTPGAARVRIDYSGFAFAYGGDFAGRLRLTEFPACALSTPSAEGCDTPTFVDAVNDTKAHTLTATVDVGPDPAAAAAAGASMVSGASFGRLAASGSLLTVVPMASSAAGDFRPTDYKASGTWDVSVASGAFSYSVPVDLPPPPVGKAPQLSWDYDSQSVDGMTSATNNQASQEGLGWSLTSSYIERRYRSCPDDGQGTQNEDLCWDSPYEGTASGHAGDGIYDIVLNGRSSVLVADATVANEFHLQDDPGWVVMHNTGMSNGDDNGEWWQVMTPDGALYDFGTGTDAKTGTATNSVLTEPVFGNDTGEPCNSQFVASTSPCTQAWRWMLDRVWDPNEIGTVYHYTKETNSYRSILGTDESRSYDMGAYLTEIDYGYASQLTGGTPNFTDKVVLSYVGRCQTRMAEVDPLRNTVPTCPSTSVTTDWPDVPLDKICTAATGNTSGCQTPLTSLSPVHFSLEMLWQINTFTIDNAGATHAVMRYQPKYDLPDDGDGAFLWLDYIQREEFTGTALVLPVINFDGAGPGDLDNIIGSGTLVFRRITTVHTDLGGLITVTYGLPDFCTDTTLPNEADNHQTCYKQQWTPDGSTTLQTGWFKKYMVTEVDVDPGVGTGTNHDGDPIQTTTYTYNSGGAGWRFPADPAQRRVDESWTEWRGFQNVTVTHAAGTGQENAVVYFQFQGLDGDRKVIAPAGPGDYKSVTVTGSQFGPAISYADSLWLAGNVYEESHRDDQGSSHQYVVRNYFAYDTAVYTGTPDAMMVRPSSTATYDQLSTSNHGDISTWREKYVQDIYDTSQNATKLFGLPVASEDDGQIGIGADNTCTKYQYAFNINPTNGSRWIALRDDAAHYNNTCAAATSANQDGDTQTFYDGFTTLATNVPFDGNPTEVDTYTAAGAHNTTTSTYDAAGRVTSATDARGHVTNTSYNPSVGWPTSGVTVTTPPPDPSGVTGSATGLVTTTVSAPDHGQPTTITDPNGNVTTLQYDAAGRLTKAWKPAQQPTTNPASVILTYTIPTTSTSVPDSPNGPPKLETQALQTGSTYVATFSYVDGLGQSRETQDPASDGSGGRIVTATRYDTAGNVTGTAAPFFNSSAPGSGMVNPAISSLVSYTSLTEDWAGRTTESQLLKNNVAQPDGHVLTAYPGPEITTVTDPNGNVTDTYTDVFGQTTKIVQHIPHIDPTTPTVTTTYTYTDKHQLASITDNAGHQTTYTYDWAAQQTQSVDHDSGTTTTTHDADGDIKTTTDGNGQLLTYVYDRLDRPTALWLGAADTGTKLTSATYDTATLGKGLPATATSWNNGAAFVTGVDSYDKDGNATGKTTTIPTGQGFDALAGSFHTGYTYNAADQPVTIVYPAVGSTGVSLPAETVTLGYTAQGLPSTLASSLATYVSATGYANYGPLTSRTYGTGTLTAGRGYTWNQATGQLTGITTTVTNAGTPTTAQNDTYGYDPGGNLLEIASSVDAQQQCFAYDDLYRLTHAFTTTTAGSTCTGASPNHTGGPSPFDLSYTYDKLGDITGSTDAITSTTATYQYNDPAHVHAVTDILHTGGSTAHDTYGYNADGNQNTRTVSGTTSTGIWDAQQRMTSMTTGANTTTFIYDAAGNRLLRKVTGDNVLYLPGQELHANGTTVTPTRYYTEGSATVAARVGGTGNGTLTWTTADSQGSAQLSVNTTSGAVASQRYLPFGAQRGSQGPLTGTNRGFLGHTTDPSTGLLQDGARYYDTNTGRFLSPDPITTPGNPQNFNAYSYSTNNPTSLSDPSGLITSAPACPGGGPDGVCPPGSSTTKPKPGSGSGSGSGSCMGEHCGGRTSGGGTDNAPSSSGSPSCMGEHCGGRASGSGATSPWTQDQLTTPPGSTWFYSGWSPSADGTGTKVTARSKVTKLATLNGGYTIIMWLKFLGLSTKGYTKLEWAEASKLFAASASGAVTVVLGSNLDWNPKYPNNIWLQYELPALEDNPNVASITAIDPATGKLTVIYENPTPPSPTSGPSISGGPTSGGGGGSWVDPPGGVSYGGDSGGGAGTFETTGGGRDQLTM